MKTVSSCFLILETYNYLNTLCLLSYFWLLLDRITLAGKNTLYLNLCALKPRVQDKQWK